ncbi:MAG: hypothetical protein FJ299_03060 [Planctomycetes bacterium]|nr:hypothetical protein [Planctomycetota bacterium]
MSTGRRCSSPFLAGLALLGFGCATGPAETSAHILPVALSAPETSAAPSALVERSCTPPPSKAFYVLTEDPLHPRIRYDDGQVSPNDSCMIRLGSKLNRRMPPAYVNGMPLGFC